MHIRLTILFTAVLGLLSSGLPTPRLAQAQATSPVGADGLPAWVKDVGARQAPSRKKVFRVGAYGAAGDGTTKDTRAIQRAIDACAAAGGGAVTFAPGAYLTGALFVKSGVNLRVDAGVTLRGSQDEADYPVMPTRVAGIEMDWPAALLNVYAQHDAEVSGAGVIDGQGQVWWDKYWAMRKDYDARGLRWAADYNCRRVRLLVVWKSTDVTIRDVHLRQSGFWNVQAVYSDHVTVDGVTVGDASGPSTDGVDVDSSRYVLVQNCDIDNHDDDVCLKAGRDSDGLRVNLPTEYVVVRGCTARRGAGICTFGSETAGFIRHVVVEHDRGIGTSVGLNFKSAKTRGGGVSDVLIRDIQMQDVKTAFSFTLDWNPSYSYATIPAGLAAKDVPPYWRMMATPVPPARGLPEFGDITIEDVHATGATLAFSAHGLAERPLRNVLWRNVSVASAQAGTIRYARDWTLQAVTVLPADGQPVAVTDSAGVAAPVLVAAPGAK